MSAKDWKRVADAPTTIDRRADVDGCDIVFRIDLRLSDRGDAAVRLRDMRRDALALAGGDAQGVWELQWCDGSARISIGRSGTSATMPEWHERQLADRIAAGERATVPAAEPWRPTVGARVVTVAKLTRSDEMRQENRRRRRTGASGVIVGGWGLAVHVRHDDGTEAPYGTDELAPAPEVKS